MSFSAFVRQSDMTWGIEIEFYEVFVYFKICPVYFHSDFLHISTDIDINFLFHQFIMARENYKSFSLAFDTSKTDIGWSPLENFFQVSPPRRWMKEWAK